MRIYVCNIRNKILYLHIIDCCRRCGLSAFLNQKKGWAKGDCLSLLGYGETNAQKNNAHDEIPKGIIFYTRTRIKRNYDL